MAGGKGGGGRGASKGSSSGNSSSSEMMKAPGSQGAYISRPAFESNPQSYFSNLHQRGGGAGGGGASKGSSSGYSTSSGMMKAPGNEGAYISRPDLESNPQSYFSNLHQCGK